MNITNSITNFCQSIHVRWSQAIYTIGLKLEQKKQKRIERKLNKAIAKFNFTLEPSKHSDTLVVINGQLIRVQFTVEGFVIRDDVTDEPINDRLLTLKVMEKIK